LPVVAREDDEALGGAWTREARAVDEAGAAIDVLEPDVVLT
jgi:hypothetical protein